MYQMNDKLIISIILGLCVALGGNRKCIFQRNKILQMNKKIKFTQKNSVNKAIPWIQKEHILIRQVVNEKRASKKHSEQLQTLKNTVQALQQQIKKHIEKNPKNAKELHPNQWALIDLEEGITRTQKELHKKHFQLFSRPLGKAF